MQYQNAISRDNLFSSKNWSTLHYWQDHHQFNLNLRKMKNRDVWVVCFSSRELYHLRNELYSIDIWAANTLKKLLKWGEPTKWETDKLNSVSILDCLGSLYMKFFLKLLKALFALFSVDRNSQTVFIGSLWQNDLHIRVGHFDKVS